MCLHCAPTERDKLLVVASYKHLAPLEQRKLLPLPEQSMLLELL